MSWSHLQYKEIYDIAKENAIVLKQIQKQLNTTGCKKGAEDYKNLNNKLWGLLTIGFMTLLGLLSKVAYAMFSG